MAVDDDTLHDPLSPDERAYFKEKASDHDMLMKTVTTIFGRETGILHVAARNTTILLGDGTPNNPGLVNAFYNDQKERRHDETKRYRYLQISIAIAGILIILVNQLLALRFK